MALIVVTGLKEQKSVQWDIDWKNEVCSRDKLNPFIVLRE
jgi:hypothetical protein